jgi:PBSX family phage terminase large subunit
MTITLEKVYAPRGTARDIFYTRAPEVLVAGPAGTGKSRGCLEKLNAVALKYPGMRGLIVRQVATSLTNTALQTYRSHVITEQLATGAVQWYGGSSQEPAQYRYSNGSSIHVAGMDKPSKIMSAEYDFIFVEEATELTEHGWEFLGTRLRNGVMPYQQLLAACNPDSDVHWLNVRCAKGQCVMLNSAHVENPVYFNDDGTMTTVGKAYMDRLDNLTGVRKLRLRDGIWAGAEGQIYDEFDPSVHVIEPFEIPKTWRRKWSVDFGMTNPFVLQCWAIDPDGRMYLYREIYRTQRLVEDHARDILSIVTDENESWIEPKPSGVVCDHDAEGRATFERHAHLGTIPAHKAVQDGIQITQARFRRAKDGRPRIFFFRNAVVHVDQELVDAKKPTSTSAELPGYVWDKNKDQPLKLNDHGSDAMRYAVVDEDLHGVTKVRFA